MSEAETESKSLKKNIFLKLNDLIKLTARGKNDFALPIYIQRRKDMGVTVTCPDMNITRSLPLPSSYRAMILYYLDLGSVLVEVDNLAIEEFKRRDFKTNKQHREKLFPRGLKDHLEVDIQKLKFKPSQAALLTTKSKRTWQWWCKERRIHRRSNGLKFDRKHYQIPFSEIEPHLKEEFIKDPSLIQSVLK